MRLLLRSFLLTFLAVTFSSLNVFSQTATIATDQPDYAPGSTAYITGTGWQPGETVTLQVLHDPTGGDDSTSPAHQPWTVVADGSGNVSSSWYVPGDADELGATLKLTADGGSSGLSASWIFTDNFTIYPDGISINSTSAQSLCVGTSANQLTATIQTCSNGGGVTGTQTAITYKWYYNTTASNNIVGATLVNTTTTTTATTTDSYIPSTTASDIGSRYYFCQVTFVPQGNGNACGGSGRSGYPYTTSTDQVTVTAFPNSPTAVNYSSAYDGQSHTASATAGTGETVDWYTTSTGSTTTAAPTGTNVGTYSAYAEARNTTTGCISSSRTLVSVTISKANPKVTVTPYSVPYDGQTHTATYSITGVNGETGATVGTIDVSATNHTNAGTYNGDAWSFTGAANYNNTNGTVNDAIAKVDPVITVTRYSVTYDGNAHTATFSVTGVKGETLSGMDVSATTHTNAGSYTSDLWKFTDVTGNYNDKSAPVDDEIAKADPTITVTPYSVAYDGNPHTATFSVTGGKGETLLGMDVSATTHTDAGSYTTDPWKFTDVTGNYNDKSATLDDEIAKADPTITVTPYSVTYDGNAHTATFSVTGVKGETLSGMDVSATTHTNADSYTSDLWKFTDVTGNYNDKSAPVDDEIAKADPTITVTPYSVAYDGNAHTATFTAVGVETTPVDLTSLMTVTGTTHTNAGDYPSDAWSFAGNGNYNTANGTVHDQIAKADPVITVTPYSVTYDGNPHTATFSVTGVKGETLLGMDVSATTHTDAGSYTTDPWKFTDVTGNYNDKSATVDDEIAKADPTITVTPYSVTYDGNAHTATFTAVGVEPTPVDLTSLMSATGTTHTNAGDYPSDAWSFAGNGNYNTANGTVHDVIAKRTITITPDAGQFKYCGQSDPTFTYTASEDLITGNSYSGAIARLGTNDVGTYSYTIGTLSAGTNYTLTLGGSNTFEIKGVSIDASNTSTAIQLGTATKQLAATVTSGTTLVNNATVTFTVTNNGNITPITVTDVTDASGVATYNLPSGSLGVGLYQVTAVAGSGCATSVAYFSVYDPNAGFVTGGGWIVSPPGAYSPDHTLTGKANFGFNSQYKKGSNVPTGNTQFQFQAGNLNFNSSSYNSGSLVIAGAKAVFQGVGTINGSGNYNFMISAIDGSISGGGGVDKFRIKIWTSDGKGVVYDNNSGNDNNADPTTALGGGSIVIHSTSSKSSRIMSPTTSGSALEVNSNQASNQTGTGPLTIKVLPNPTSYYFTAGLQSLSKYNVNLVVTDITGRVIEQRTNIAANSTIQFGSSYHPGTYIAQFMQGNDKVTIRLIKEGE